MSLHGVGNVGLSGTLVDGTLRGENCVADDDLLAGDESVGPGGVEVELRDRLEGKVGGRGWWWRVGHLLGIHLLETGGVPRVVPDRGEASIPGPELWDLVEVHLIKYEGGLEGCGVRSGDVPVIVEVGGGHHLVLIEITLENDIQILRPVERQLQKVIDERLLIPYLREAIRQLFNTTEIRNDLLLDHAGQLLLLLKPGTNNRGTSLEISSPSVLTSVLAPIKMRPFGFLSPFSHFIGTFSQREVLQDVSQAE